ncbi:MULTISPECIES: DUF6153 family protein [unclassified Streptomyces]|uniref:DUF6153 family protein n=1 Tax=unclassified Streptomyces TaxID=2593676 RepID=UPI002254F39E|nr:MULTISPECIES: DUF6153 family protein [unclassified Streptomyces]MCX5334575.1 DUF6153 family protein [Streptomyces sp. NBC_00140]MCX5364069.1 DUF6153 family protein [Streptomyces sp. NBC_00124]
MNGPEHHPASPPRWRWRALLVLALLAGLMGMHALAPGAAVADEHPHTPPPMAAVSVSVSAPHGDCAGEGHCGSGHVTHADTTCSAASVSGGPSLPALVPDPVAIVVRDESPRAYAGSDPEGARAPPSLAELQLLRI